jgi:uncharacterized protein
MPVDPELLELLACPSADHAPLRLERRADGDIGEVLICTVCASEFDVRDGVPVLLMDEARPGPAGFGHPAALAPDAP